MDDRLTKEEVLHVAHLARIEIRDDEIEKYQVELKQLLDDVDKIKSVKNYDEELMITPVDYEGIPREDVEKDRISLEQIKENIPHVKGNLIEVPVMIND